MTGLSTQIRVGALSASIQLLRPGSVAATATVCLVGAYLARPIGTEHLLPGVIAVGAAVAGSNVLNDIRDLEADRINVPQRPLPSSAVSVPMAWGMCIALTLVALAGGLLVSPLHGAFVGIVLVLSFAYSLILKKVLILGAVVVAVLLGVALLFGASLGTVFSSDVTIGFIEIAVFTFGRETLKGIRDVEGDRRAGVATIANTVGPRAAIQTFVLSCFGVSVLAVAASSSTHLAVMALLVTLPGALIGFRCLRAGTEESIRQAIAQSSLLWATGLTGIAMLGV